MPGCISVLTETPTKRPNERTHTETEMRSSCLLQLLLVVLVLVSVEPQDVMGPSCFISTSGDGQTRTTFLLEDRAGVRSVYWALWSEDMQLVSCTVHTDPLVTEEYLSLCNKNKTQNEVISRRLDVSAVVAPGAHCAHVSNSVPKSSGRTSGVTVGRSRRKRAWIFPGTLWCGSGSKAIGYEELGMFERADRCCREHDYCLHIIPAFTLNYGVFNSKFYTVSHCECDQRFRECLLSVNDSISTMVGYSFFNILRVPCFELKQLKRCTEMYWWGMCKIAKVAPYAVYKTPHPYNTFNVTTNYPDIHHSSTPGSEQNYVTTVSPDRKGPQIKHTWPSRHPPRGDTFQCRLATDKNPQQLHEEAPSPIPPTLPTLTTTVPLKTPLLKNSKSHFMILKKNTSKNDIANIFWDYLPQLKSSAVPQRNTFQHLTTAAVSQYKATKKNKLAPKGNLCCKTRKPTRGDAFQPVCQSCQEQDAGSPKAKATTTAAQHLSIVLTSSKANMVNKSKNTKKRPHKQPETNQTWRNTSHEPMGSDPSHSTHVEGSHHQANYPSRNKTGDLCRSLRQLDECKFTIPSLKKKHELHNLDSKTVYHCNCTSRLAVQIESLEQLGILSSILMDFVSQQCFMLPKERLCPNRESCSPGFTEASDLHRALKKIEKKETAWVQISGSGRKRRNPVRLYKRCLRLQREVDFMGMQR